MAKEGSEKEKPDKEGKKERKEKKEGKRSGQDGVHKSKRDKSEKKHDHGDNITSALLESLEDKQPQGALEKVNGDSAVRAPLPLGALVPFANPLADEKVQKKVLKSVKKAAKNRSIKRGVKEVVKSLRKSPIAAVGGAPPGVVVLAADISPIDVISHIPVLCEDHNIPYVFVTSRAELGAAGSTKRPTSVVLVSPEKGGKRKAEEGAGEGEEDFKGVFKSLVKVVEKESRNVRF